MERLYDRDPYLREFEATVTDCRKGKDGYEIYLDRTAFYPEGGGQPPEGGMLGGIRILDVQETEAGICHYAEGPLTPGERVRGTLDWKNRFSNMQQHTGEHIVSGLIHRQYGYHNVGFHMGRTEMTIDLSGELTWEQLMEIEREANQVVWENRSVQVTYPSEDELKTLEYRFKKELTGPIRIVEIQGADCCACCGTHVARTGEIGCIKFLSMIRYKGGVRISMLCGMEALFDYEARTEQMQEMSVLLSAKTDGIAAAIRQLKQENARKDGEIGTLRRRLMDLIAEEYPEQEGGLSVFEPELSPVQVRQLADLLLEKQKGSVVLVCSGSEGSYSYCVGSRVLDVRETGKWLNGRLNGRGGGNARMVQGTFQARKEEIETVFHEAEIIKKPEAEGGYGA